VLAFDTNVLIYAANADSELHDPCLSLLEEARRNPSPSFLTWNVCYEFMRVVTHPAVLRIPWSPQDSQCFITTLLESPGFSLLTASDRHAAVLSQTLEELPDIRGNMVHDLHTAVLMREHGISRICTRDTDFYRFPFLQVVDPLR
jgi:toxin-antitoxin system PIN domain toxin